MKTFTKIMAEMISALANEGGSATFATLTAIVEVKQNKTGNPYRDAEIRKRTVYNVLLNANYAKMVRTRQTKEGLTPDFQAKENWMVKVQDTVNGNLCTHRADAILDGKGNFVRFAVETPRLYLMICCNTANRSKTLDYFINGETATPEQVQTIKQFVPTYKEAEQGGIEDKVIIRTITILDTKKHKGIEEFAANKMVMSFDPVLLRPSPSATARRCQGR